MESEGERRRLAARAVEVTERFGLDRVMTTWNEVLEKTVRREQTDDTRRGLVC
jgi:hypothetical protein